MKTDELSIEDLSVDTDKVLQEAEAFCKYNKFSEKDTRRIRLITEEALGLLRALTKTHTGVMYFEKKKNICKVHISVLADVNIENREQFLSVSKSGKNTASKGLLGKIREIIELSFMNTGDEELDKALQGGVCSVPYVPIDLAGSASAAQMDAVNYWSLTKYNEELEKKKDKDSESKEAWDELEKSVLNNIADDVNIGITKGRVVIEIIKNI
ncbi:MAG: hypothetical protein K6F99_09895 [Lachnospiraceae bacterium]|nr:hypothetical protein [Lachnospiraceae bacterium]